MGINQRQNVYNKSPHKIISSQKCAGYLMFNGCRLIRTEQNQNNPKLNVFIFYDDDLVRHYLTEYSKQGDSKNYDRIHNRQDKRRI